MQAVHRKEALKQAAVYALYPWIADPSVKLVWLSRAVYAVCVAVAAYGPKACPMIAQLIGIQIFFSMTGMNRNSRYALRPRWLRMLAIVVIGVAFSALVTLSLFCFEELTLLVELANGRATHYDYVFYLSPVIFVVLTSTWLLAAKSSNTVNRPAV